MVARVHHVDERTQKVGRLPRVHELPFEVQGAGLLTSACRQLDTARLPLGRSDRRGIRIPVRVLDAGHRLKDDGEVTKVSCGSPGKMWRRPRLSEGVTREYLDPGP